MRKHKNKMMFNDYMDMWILDHRPHIKESTYVTYLFHIQKHIKPYFKGIMMYEMNTNLIQDFIDEKLNHGRIDQTGGLSVKSVRELVNIIKLSLKEAIKQQ